MVTLKSYVPATGRGAFDCSYIPGSGKNSGTFTITVRVFADFENRPTEHVQWSEADKVQFRKSAQESIQRNWNGKSRFINHHKNPIATAIPTFGVQFVPKEEEATVVMRVPRYASAYGPGGLARCDSYVGLEQINSGDIRAQSTAMVHSESTQPINVKITEAGNVSRDERRRIEEIVAELRLGDIPIDPRGVITRQLNVDLANFAFRLKSGPPSRPLVPIVVDIHINQMSGGSTMNALNQGTHIRDKLISFHPGNPVAFRRSQGHASRITINPDTSFETTFDQDMWMDIFAHEFGHMIGLPDEYDALPALNSQVAKDLVIHRFLGIADYFGTPKPTMGRMTTSIMCKGRDILPCHMVTALQALCVVDKDNDWRVG